MRVITSRQHPLVRTFRDVARGDDSRALLDGWHLLHEAVESGLDIDTVAIVGEPQRAADAALLDRVIRGSHVVAVSVSAAVMNAMSPVRTPTGVVALVRRPHVAISQLLAPQPPLIIVAIDVQDPGNAGAIVRAAEAGGATGVVFAGDSADAWGWKALRSAMGSTFRLPVLQQSDPIAVCNLLHRHDVTLFATAPRGGVPMSDANLRNTTAVLFGGEGAGLTADVQAIADRPITIPMQHPVESLNVAVAVGVLVYEAKRQRSG